MSPPHHHHQQHHHHHHQPPQHHHHSHNSHHHGHQHQPLLPHHHHHTHNPHHHGHHQPPHYGSAHHHHHPQPHHHVHHHHRSFRERGGFSCCLMCGIFTMILLFGFLGSLGVHPLRSTLFKTQGQPNLPTDLGIAEGGCASNWIALEGQVNTKDSFAKERPLSGRLTATLPWDNFPYSSATTLDLPLNSSTLFLLSRGAMATGSVDVVTSETQPSDTVSVQVVVHYFLEEIRNLAQVCVMQRGQGENGVGIITPQRRRIGLKARLQFDTTVTFPTADEGGEGKLKINKFETDLASMSQRLHDLAEDLDFGSLDLNGSNGGIEIETLLAGETKVSTTNGNIRVGTLTAQDVHVQTSNGGIQGSFNSTQGLTLATNNGKVDVDVGLTSIDDNLIIGNISTTNGYINARVSLLSNAATGGNFNVTTITSNGYLDVSFPSSPVDSKLEYYGRTKNSGVNLALNPAYEGTFHLQTTNARAKIQEDRSVEDPSGEGRRRAVVTRTATGKEIAGSVAWVDKDHSRGRPKGSVDVATNNAAATLVL